MTKMANDPSNVLFKMDSGLYKHTPGHKEEGDKIKTEKLDELLYTRLTKTERNQVKLVEQMLKYQVVKNLK
jgi:hypothetical protein